MPNWATTNFDIDNDWAYEERFSVFSSAEPPLRGAIVRYRAQPIEPAPQVVQPPGQRAIRIRDED